MHSYDIRDSKLKSLTTDWLKNLSYNNDIKSELIPIQPEKRHSLTHWRELSIACSNKKLCIYPDGGFINNGTSIVKTNVLMQTTLLLT